MKAVLISIQPKWCELIASGKKTVEVRKTKPKIETPFKCYIYCTQGKGITDNFRLENNDLGNSKVIGEFVSWFQKPCICKSEYDGEEYKDCLNCDLAGDSDYGIVACNRPITRPPQSWCYVEELR